MSVERPLGRFDLGQRKEPAPVARADPEIVVNARAPLRHVFRHLGGNGSRDGDVRID